MSKPAEGNYYLVNRVASLSGEPLTLTYGGRYAAVTVVERQNLPTQVWVLRNYKDGKTQGISPQAAPDLEIGIENGILTTVPLRDNIWTVRESQGYTTVQDAGLTGFWGLERPIDRESVTFGRGTGDEKQIWVLSRVPSR